MPDERLPHRFHIGTQRAGSTFLYNLLRLHPEVSLSPAQEVHFYSSNFDKGLDWYGSNFSDGVAIDTSPKYFMLGDVVAERIRQTVGSETPRFLLVLRDPIDYVHSHFRLHLKRGYFDQHPELYPAPASDLRTFIERYPAYLDRGRYAKILQTHWLPRFDLQQFKIVLFEDLIGDPATVMRDILGFLELPQIETAVEGVNENRILRSKALYRARDAVVRMPRVKERLKRSELFRRFYDRRLVEKSEPLDPDTRSFLADALRGDVGRLKDLLQRDPGWHDFPTTRL